MAIGIAIRQEKITNKTKSLDNNRQRFETDAPSTFRMPIYLVRCSAMNEANPNKPRQLIKMARKAKKLASLPMRSSAANINAYS